MFSQTSPQIRLKYYVSCWTGIAAFTSAQHMELNIYIFFKAIRNTKNPIHQGAHFVCKFAGLSRFFHVYFGQVQVEDETTLNEVPCDLSRFHAQLRDHSPLDLEMIFEPGFFGSPLW